MCICTVNLSQGYIKVNDDINKESNSSDDNHDNKDKNKGYNNTHTRTHTYKKNNGNNTFPESYCQKDKLVE